jgi:hypothetical protein
VREQQYDESNTIRRTVMDEATKKDLEYFANLVTTQATDDEWGALGKIASKFGLSPAIIIRFIFYVWRDLKNRIEAKG